MTKVDLAESNQTDPSRVIIRVIKFQVKFWEFHLHSYGARGLKDCRQNWLLISSKYVGINELLSESLKRFFKHWKKKCFFLLNATLSINFVHEKAN